MRHATAQALLEAAHGVIDQWTGGGLAEAVRALDDAVTTADAEGFPVAKVIAHDPDKDIDQTGRTNGDRAEAAEAAVVAACRMRCECLNVDEDGVRDLLADLGHLCDREGIDFAALIATAVADWEYERDGCDDDEGSDEDDDGIDPRMASPVPNDENND